MSATTTELSAEAIAAVDKRGQLADILSMPEQLRDALWRVESAGLEAHDARDGMVIAGMGGSGIGGLLAREVLGDRASRPIAIARDYCLPPGTTPETTVLCCSYSGQTEETLAAYEAAGVLGAHRIVCTTGGRLADAARADGVPVVPLPGGYQPRATVGYTLVVALEVAALVGVSEQLHTEIDVAAAHATELVAQWGPDAAEDSLAKTLARGLHGTIPLITGAGLTDAGRLPLEDPAQREREDAVLLRRASRARPQRDRGVGGSREARPLQCRVPRRLRSAPASAPADRA